MSHSPQPHLVTGAAMDSVVARNPWRRRGLIIGGGAVLAFAVWLGIQFLPQGVRVAAADLRVAQVEQGMFLDEAVIRASALPLNTVLLDAVEIGRVEQVMARDGAMVKAGEPLFRLSNVQRNIDLLARQSEQAQQISNLSNLRVAQQVSRREHARRLDELEFQVQQAAKSHTRTAALAAQKFVSDSALQESVDSLAYARRKLWQEQETYAFERRTQDDAVRQMELATATVERGMVLVRASVDALEVRAPVAGRLTGFSLQVGETVKADQHIGRIDDPSHFKLSGQVDEFYLSRLGAGRHGKAMINGREYAVSVNRIFPQIKDGRFTAELLFDGPQPEVLNPGQSVDVQISLSDPNQALLLPNGPFINDTGGAWIFVLSPDQRSAERRAIRIGRRSGRQVEVSTGLKAGERVIVSSYAGFAKAERLQLAR